MKKTGKTKKLIALFAALALTLTALTSCSAVSDAFDFLYDALTNGGVRVLGDFNDLTYEKPDFDAIDNDIDELKSALAEGKKTKSYYIDRLSEIIGKYYYDALTMENLAFLRNRKKPRQSLRSCIPSAPRQSTRLILKNNASAKAFLTAIPET